MAKLDLKDTIHAGNKRTLAFAVKDTAGAAFDLTGYSARYALSVIDPATGLASKTALFEKTSATAAEITITNAVGGLLSVFLKAADTVSLLGDYHFELEIVDTSDSEPIVVADGTLTIRRNITNA